jgi:hypothetical protein
MTRTINDLNTTDTLAGDDKLVIWKDQAGATRAITAADAADYFSLSGGPYQPQDELLTAIAALGPSTANGDFIQATGQDAVRVRKLTVATYAALTAIAAAFRFDDMLVYVASRATDGDGGEGWWRFDAASSATADAGTILAPDVGSGRWLRVDTQFYKPEWFGAIGNGSTNDTVALQACATVVRLAGGGVIQLTAAKNYRIVESILIGSKTTIEAYGATISAAQATWVGLAVNLNCYLLRNYNFTASVLTDESIEILGLKTDFGDVIIAGGGAHAIAMRFVKRVVVRDCEMFNGENATAFLACQDTVTDSCFSYDMGNCHFDHWDGSGNCMVTNCTARNAAGKTGAQGIQFTGTGTLVSNTSVDCVVTGCLVSGIRTTPAFASGIITNANDGGSATFRFRSIGNIIEDCDLGLVYSGDGGQHLSLGDTIREVDGQPILIQLANSDDPDHSRILDCHLIDCEATGTDYLIDVVGSYNQIRGLTVTNTGSVGYDYILRIQSGTNNLIDITAAPSGTVGRITDSGTSTRVIDQLQRYQEVTWTPFILFGGLNVGVTYSEQVGTYVRVGRLVFFQGRLNLTSKGSSAGQFQLPTPLEPGNYATSGNIIITYIANAASLGDSQIMGPILNTQQFATMTEMGATGVVALDNTNIANNTIIAFSGWMEVAAT